MDFPLCDLTTADHVVIQLSIDGCGITRSSMA